MLKWFPKLLNDIYLSEEYYGENVLHMGCVAEDASLVKWLLDIGSDIHRKNFMEFYSYLSTLTNLLFKTYNRRCYGNFFCCDDQKPHRTDSTDHEHVDVPLYTNYLGKQKISFLIFKTLCLLFPGYVSWGEYPMNFAAVLNQEEIYRLKR